MTAPRVLLAWEHGRNFGHLARLGALAQSLADQGAEPLWAVPEAHLEHPDVVRGGTERWAAPRAQARPRQRDPLSYADILLASGFDDGSELRRAVGCWLDVFSQSRAQAVVLDYAPAAQLAALVAGLPALKISNGFDSPPASCPIFGWRLRGGWVERQNAERTRRLDETVVEVTRSYGVRGSVEALFAHARLLLDCLPEADPYGPRDGASYVGPLGAPATTHAVPWPEGSADAPRVFVYLRESELLRPALGALVRLRARVICVCPDARTDLLQGDCEHVRVVREPVPVAQVLADADAVLNYGSTTLVSQTLAAGRPQLMLPMDVEKWLVARRVAECGAGLMATVPDRIPQQLAQLFEQPFARRAHEIAAAWACHDRRGIVTRKLAGLLDVAGIDVPQPSP